MGTTDNPNRVKPEPAILRRLRRLSRPIQTFTALLKALILVGCNLTGLREPIPPTPPPPPTSEPSPAVPADGWELVLPGLERRFVQPEGLGPFSAVVIHRIDPDLFTFRAHINLDEPLYNTQWRERFPRMTLFVNANFFDPSHNPLGLVVADGQAVGVTYVNRGGMFAVQDGVARVQSLVRSTYDGAPLEQAVQGFPMLVTDYTPNYQTAPGDRSSRRTVVALDSRGRVLLISTTLLGMTLDEMAAFLVSPDLDIVNALNLDGGGSTLMEAPDASLPSLDPVPVILAVYPK